MKNAGIRMGAEYLEGLRDDREIWTRGARMKDVTAEPGIQGGAASLAGFLDPSARRGRPRPRGPVPART